MLNKVIFNGLLAAAAHIPPKVLTFHSEYADAVNRSEYTFTSCGIGAATYDRRVIVAVALGGGAPVTDVVIGGVTATLLADSIDEGISGVSIWIAHVPTGTTATVVCTCTGGSSRLGIGVWSATGLKSNTPHDTNASDSVRSADMPVNTTVGGFALGVSSYRNNSFPATNWTNLTEVYDGWIENGGTSHSGAQETETDGLALAVNSYSAISGNLTHASAVVSF